MPNDSQALQMQVPQNLELIEHVADIIRHGAETIQIGMIQASSRPKRSKGWECQDKAAISILNSPLLDLGNLKKAYQAAAAATEGEEGGCSSTTVIVSFGMAHVAWLGDSPAFLVGVNRLTSQIEEIKGLNESHIPLYDAHDIQAKGGVIDADGRLDLATSAQDQINNYSLSMSRSFGNHWLSSLLSREPGLISVSLNALEDGLDWYILVGSDGILPESERNLMFPSQRDAQPEENDIINRCAVLFKNMVNTSAQSSLAENKNWAAAITHLAQTQLQLMEASANKQLVGYPAVDDTTLLLLPLAAVKPGLSIVMTVTDGHRNGGEITAEKAITSIHESLASQI